jgi:hypothetical protein
VWDSRYRPHLVGLDPRRICDTEIRLAFQRARAKDLFLCFHNAFLWENLRASLGDLCML